MIAGVKLASALGLLTLLIVATFLFTGNNAVARRQGDKKPTAGSSKPATSLLSSTQTDATKRKAAEFSYLASPLLFEANKGQTDARVKYLTRGTGATLFLTPQEVVFSVPNRTRATQQDTDKAKTVSFSALRMRLVGANPSPHLRGEGRAVAKANYLIGNNRKKWQVGVPLFTKVRYEDVYPGIDLLYYGNQRQTEYDFVVSPGADYEKIRLRFSGVQSASLGEQGDLNLCLPTGAVVTHQSPIVYQRKNGKRIEIKAHYTLSNTKSVSEVGFALEGKHDSRLPLVIDPVVVYSTYVGGGSLSDAGCGVAVDAAGSVYISGNTNSANFPTTAGAYDATLGGGQGDAFVAKISANGSTLLYSTYIGGSNQDGVSSAIAVDGDGNAHITGITGSSDFPTTTGAFDTSYNGMGFGDYDGFVTKLNASGSGLIYSTYLGGTGYDSPRDIALDQQGNAVVAGHTMSADFPTTPGAYDRTNDTDDAFVTKLNAQGTAQVFGTLFGGSGQDRAYALALDSAGDIYITGLTYYGELPTSPQAFQATNAGDGDAYVAKINATGTSLLYCTYLGGSRHESAFGIAVDAAGCAYVTGMTGSGNFPLVNPSDNTFGGGGYYPRDAFLTKVSADARSLVYSTYLGGSGEDIGLAVVTDVQGQAYVTGRTYSADFPTTVGAIGTAGSGTVDGFVTKFTTTGSMTYGTYLGGAQFNSGEGITVDASGFLYVTGYTGDGYPTTAGAADVSFAGAGDPFLTKFDIRTPSVTVTSPNQFSEGSVTITGTGTPGNTVQITLNGVTITVTIDANGNWSVTFPNVPPGNYVVTITVTNPDSGQVGTISYPIVVGQGVTVAAPRSLEAYSTGSNKISLYWNKVPNAIGYNVYRSATSQGQNYSGSPLNGATPTNVESYAGSQYVIFTDSSTPDGSSYFYTVKAVFPSGVTSDASPETSETASPFGIPWDTRNATLVLSALRSAYSVDDPLDCPLRVVGPDNSIYDDDSAVALPPDIIGIANSTTAVQASTGVIFAAMQAPQDNGADPPGAPAPASNGPYRIVRTAEEIHRACRGEMFLPSRTEIQLWQNATNAFPDTAYIYLGANRRAAGQTPALETDAGLQYSPTTRSWGTYFQIAQGSGSVGINAANNNDLLRGVSPQDERFRFDGGATVTMTYFAFVPRRVIAPGFPDTLVRVNASVLIVENMEGERRAVAGAVQSGAGVRVKRVHSIAQSGVRAGVIPRPVEQSIIGARWRAGQVLRTDMADWQNWTAPITRLNGAYRGNPDIATVTWFPATPFSAEDSIIIRIPPQ